MNRRNFLAGIPALFAAPSIVRAESLMRLSVPLLSFADFYEVANSMGCDLVIDKAAPGLAAAYAANPVAYGPGDFCFMLGWDRVKCLGLGRVSRETMSLAPLRFARRNRG